MNTMNYDPLVALVTMTPIKRLTEENAKKKSRWGNNAIENETIDKNQEGNSKWGSEDYKPYLPLPFVDFPPGLTPAQLDQFLREQRFDELTKKLNKGELEYADPDIRPPSPPPIYDKNGSRINTREARTKNSMIEEYNRLVEYLLKHVEGFVAPPNYKPIKKIRKIEIPVEEYPEYNFMGLIIGPRGCNHKRLEAESGAQISIRGKGTLKEGKKTDHQTEIEANMPKHVHISADTEESIEKAVSLIIPLLDPKHPQHEEHKRKGLEQLAIVNGININQLDTIKCSFCGSSTHTSVDCNENANFQSFKKPEIKCNLCGDHGHITLDCKLATEKKINQNNEDTAFGESELNNHIHNNNNNNNISNNMNNNINYTYNSSSSTFIPPPPSEDNFKKSKKSPNKYDKQQVDLEYQKMMNELTFSENKDNGKKDESYRKGGGGTNQSPSSLNKNSENGLNQYNDSYRNINYGVPSSGNDFRKTVPSPPPFFNNPPPFPPMLNQFMADKNGEINPNFIPLNYTSANNTNATADEMQNGNICEDANKNINNNLTTINKTNYNNNSQFPSHRNTSISSTKSAHNNTKTYPPLINMPNPSNLPLGPPPLPLHLPPIMPPPFFNSWPNNKNSTNNCINTNTHVPYSGHYAQTPIDPIYGQKVPNGWPHMPMNFSPDDPFINAPPPECNPPPLPSENGRAELEQENNRG